MSKMSPTKRAVTRALPIRVPDSVSATLPVMSPVKAGLRLADSSTDVISPVSASRRVRGASGKTTSPDMRWIDGTKLQIGKQDSVDLTGPAGPAGTPGKDGVSVTGEQGVAGVPGIMPAEIIDILQRLTALEG